MLAPARALVGPTPVGDVHDAPDLVTTHCCALEIEVRIPLGDSLKAKRAVIRPILDGAHRRFGVASAEVDLQDRSDAAVLAFAAVASSVGHVEDVLDRVDRFVWSFPEIEVVDAQRYWVDTS